MSVQIDKFDYSVNSVSCPLKEHSITNYIFRPIKKDRKGRKRLNNSTQNTANNEEQALLVKIAPLELGESANISYSTYQSALASATESLFEENNNIPVSNLILAFSHLKYFDPCTQTFKSPEPTSVSHIEFIFKNTDFFSKRYIIKDSTIYRK